MKANLIEIRKKDFVSKDTNETIEGYVATFLVPSYKADYPPSLVSFYLQAEHYLTYLLLRKLDVSKINPNGSSLAAGHPFAATGARIVASDEQVECLNTLREDRGKMHFIALHDRVADA